MNGIQRADRLLWKRRCRSLDQLGRDVDHGPLGRGSREHPEEVLGIGWGSLARASSRTIARRHSRRVRREATTPSASSSVCRTSSPRGSPSSQPRTRWTPIDDQRSLRSSSIKRWPVPAGLRKPVRGYEPGCFRRPGTAIPRATSACSPASSRGSSVMAGGPRAAMTVRARDKHDAAGLGDPEVMRELGLELADPNCLHNAMRPHVTTLRNGRGWYRSTDFTRCLLRSPHGDRHQALLRLTRHPPRGRTSRRTREELRGQAHDPVGWVRPARRPGGWQARVLQEAGRPESDGGRARPSRQTT